MYRETKDKKKADRYVKIIVTETYIYRMEIKSENIVPINADNSILVYFIAY